MLQHPLPTALRCYKLARRCAARSSRIPRTEGVVVGTGGLSHQIHGERTGFNNTEWDMEFLDLIERDPQRLDAMTHVDYVRLGGAEGAEVIMWLAMRGALRDRTSARCTSNYYLPTTHGDGRRRCTRTRCRGSTRKHESATRGASTSRRDLPFDLAKASGRCA